MKLEFDMAKIKGTNLSGVSSTREDGASDGFFLREKNPRGSHKALFEGGKASTPVGDVTKMATMPGVEEDGTMTGKSGTNLGTA